MALPRKLKHLNLFNDVNNWQGIIESLTLPKFTRKFEKYRGGSMAGAVDVGMGLDDGVLDTELMSAFGSKWNQEELVLSS